MRRGLLHNGHWLLNLLVVANIVGIRHSHIGLGLLHQQWVLRLIIELIGIVDVRQLASLRPVLGRTYLILLYRSSIVVGRIGRIRNLILLIHIENK